MSHYCGDIGTMEVDAYIITRRAQADSIQTINSGEIAALMRVQRHRKAIVIAATPLQRTHGVKCGAMTVSAGRLLGLDRVT